MASTYLSPFEHQHQHEHRIFFSTSKPFSTHKLQFCNRNFFNLVSPLNLGRISATVTNVSTALNTNAYRSGNQEEDLPAGLEEELMPRHIGFILDGNRRWAKEKGLTPMAGHHAMRMALKPLLLQCCRLKIKVVSLYAFSTENWSRPTEQVDFLMEMYEDLLRNDSKELLSLGCRISVAGYKQKLPKTLQDACIEIEEISKANSGTHVNFAINYSGKNELIQACRNIATKVKNGDLPSNQINENIFKEELDTKFIDFPDLDLVIRTSGEMRISNFMLWQMAHGELRFVNKYFPDFGENDLLEALLAFQETHKRL